MPSANRGEVWQVNLGMVAKARPAVIISIPFRDDERALYAIVPHTTALRGGRFEVPVRPPLAATWRIRRTRHAQHSPIRPAA